MAKKSKLFLDTTIQIERTTATTVRQLEIAYVLQEHDVMTSTYVLGEYLRVLINDAAILHEFVQTTEHMYDVETRIANLFSKRSLSRCLLLWAALHHSGIYDRNMVLRKLKMDIQHGFLNRFMVGVDELIDTTSCGLARERPLLDNGKYQLRTQCTRRVKECELVTLLTKYMSEIQIVADGLKGHQDSSLARMSTICTKILDNPDIARGRNCTWYLGDLVIVLEMPVDATLYTTNRRLFEPLCDLLGKSIYTV